MGPTTSGNHQAKKVSDPEIPVSDPSPLLTPLMPPLIPSTATFPLHLSPSFTSTLPLLFLSSSHPGCPSFPCLFGSGPNPNRLSNCSKNILPFSAPSAPPFLSCVHPKEQTLSFIAEEVPVSVWSRLAGYYSAEPFQGE